MFFFFQAEDGIRDKLVTGVQTCALPIYGAVILTRRTRTTPAVTINIGIRAGSVCDPADAPGAMYMLSKVIDRGTTVRSGDDIAEALDSRGISLGISVTRHLFSFICTCLAD